MSQYEDFTPSLSIHVTQCPRIVMINAIKTMVRQFLEQSNVWVYEVMPVQVDSEITQAFLQIPQFSYIHKVWSLYGQNGVLSYRHDKPKHHITQDNQIVIDESIPSTTLNLIVSLSLNQNALSCPDFIFEKYLDVIVHGSAHYLMMMANQQWTNPDLAQYHYQQFMAGIEKAKSNVEKGFGLAHTVRRVRPQYL